MSTTSSLSPEPIQAHLASVEIVGNLEGNYLNTRLSHFVKVYVDDTKVAQSEKKPRMPAPRWEWNKEHQFLVHPSSTLKIAVHRKSYGIIKQLVGEHIGKVTDLLENGTTLDLKDQGGTGIAAKIKISLSLVSNPKTEENAKSFMEVIDANVSRLNNAVQVPAGYLSLGTVLQLTKNIMDRVANAHPILKASWTILSAVYAAVQQVKLLDETICDLAESLRELLGVVKKLPDLPLIQDTTNITEEVGRASLKVAMLVGEYTKLSVISRTVNTQLSDDMKNRIAQCQKSLRDLKEKFDTRLMMAIQSQVAEIKGDMNKNLETIIENQRAKDIYQWLSAPDSSNNYNDARKRHQKDTCSWFLDGARFREWEEKANFVWIKGTAGSGKTILCSSVIEKIIELCKKKTTYYAYFFFDGRDSQKNLQLHDQLIRSLIHQISHQCGGIPAPLSELYGHGHQQPSTRLLQDTLHRIIDGLDSVYIIVDSLDECVDRKETLQWIDEVTSLEIDNLHMLVTSRPERDISDILGQCDPCCVDLRSEDNHDIGIYLDKQLKEEKKWDTETQEIVKSNLQAGADGMFRWVALQLMELKKCSNRHLVMKRLKCLPKGLNETYDRILQKIDNDDDRADGKTFLVWLCFSVRPITLTELSETIMVDLDEKNGPQYIPSRRYWNQQDILDKCPGLVTESEGYVKLAHFSIKEYLMSDHLFTGAVGYFHLAEELSHSFIAQTCLAYLLQFDVVLPSHVSRAPPRLRLWTNEPTEFDKSSPLANYAAKHWIVHAQYGGIDKHDQSATLTLAKKLFVPNEAAFANWVQMWNIDERPLHWIASTHTDFASPLYYASLAGLRQVSQHLLEEGDPNVQEGRYGNALQAASAEGHEAVVKLLLEKGSDIHAQGGNYGNALQAASARGNEAVVKLLLEKGADIHAQGGMHGNALQAASFRGNEAVVKLLLEKGSDIHAQGGMHGNALQAASAAGNEAVVKLLLEKGSDIHAQGGDYGNALQAASSGGNEAIVKLLLEKGSDIHAQGGMHGNALQAASARGNEAVVKLLLEKGSDIHTQGGDYGNALQAASAAGNEAVVKLLLEKGADIHAQGGIHGNALQAASVRGNEAVVKLLLEKGADIHAQGRNYGSALQAASAAGNEAVVKLLLEKGSDIHAQGGMHGNALQAASAAGNEAVVKLLLEKGSDIHVQGGRHGNALQAASSGGNEAIVKLLLEKGADIHAQGGDYGNALQAASAGGNEAIVKLLLEKGADIHAQGGDYGNALQAASTGGNEAIVKLLLEKGSDIHAQGGMHGNALQAASSGGNEAIVKLLLEKGADIHAQGGIHGNALQAASAGGNEAIVKLLLEKGSDIHVRGGYFGNALQAASANGCEAVVKLLLEKGSDINAQGEEYRNLLQEASAGQHEAVMVLLLENGAEVPALGTKYANALPAALAAGHREVVSLVLADMKEKMKDLPPEHRWHTAKFFSSLQDSTTDREMFL